jgi:hypothetical protein
MDTGNPINPEATTQSAPQEQQQTFTQDDVNRIVAKRVSKYADYEVLKEKAAKFDAAEEANKSELQKATERADSLQKELEAMKSAEQLRSLREEVANSKGVPAGLLTGTTKEECESQAESLLNWAKPNSYPKVPDGGEPVGSVKKSTRDQFAEWMNNMK